MSHAKLNLDLGQHMLVDKSILSKIVELAELKKSDRVLEIGPGSGALTHELCKKSKVIAIEVDRRFEKELRRCNAEIIWDDATHFFRKQKRMKGYQRFRMNKSNILEIKNIEINKIVSNLPYHICEPLVYCLFYEYDFKLAVLTVPKTFAEFLMGNSIAKALLTTEVALDVPRSAFKPIPGTDSCIVVLKPRRTFNDKEALLKSLYLLRTMKLKNALREALIDLYKCTKRGAKEKISNFKLSKDLLETNVHELRKEDYELLSSLQFIP